MVLPRRTRSIPLPQDTAVFQILKDWLTDNKCSFLLRKVDHYGLESIPVPQVHSASIYVLSMTISPQSSCLVNMSKYVKKWLHLLLNHFSEFFAATMNSLEGQISNHVRRTMSDENVSLFRDLAPYFPERFASRQVKAPVAELRLPWRPVDIVAFNLQSLVL